MEVSSVTLCVSNIGLGIWKSNLLLFDLFFMFFDDLCYMQVNQKKLFKEGQNLGHFISHLFLLNGNSHLCTLICFFVVLCSHVFFFKFLFGMEKRGKSISLILSSLHLGAPLMAMDPVYVRYLSKKTISLSLLYLKNLPHFFNSFLLSPLFSQLSQGHFFFIFTLNWSRQIQKNVIRVGPEYRSFEAKVLLNGVILRFNHLFNLNWYCHKNHFFC